MGFKAPWDEIDEALYKVPVADPLEDDDHDDHAWWLFKYLASLICVGFIVGVVVGFLIGRATA